MDARPEQAFVRVNVSDPHHDVRVHQQLLDADIAAARGAIEELGREMLAERLDAEPREQGMTQRIAVLPQHHAEASRVAQAQYDAAENEIHMIVLAGEGSMLGPHSQLHIRAAALRLLAAMAFVVFAGCAATPPQQAAAGEEAQDESDADAPAGEVQALAPEAVDRTALPNQELTENLLYEFLLAEIAGQRGNAALSAQAYVDLAKRTRDPRIARRATEVALYARTNHAAVEPATV